MFKPSTPIYQTPLVYLTPLYDYSGPLKRAVDIARFYGFRLITPPKAGRNDIIEHAGERRRENRLPLIRTFIEQRMDAGSEPAMFVYTEKVPYRPIRSLHLTILGNSTSSAEGVLLHTASAIFKEHGIKDLSVQ